MVFKSLSSGFWIGTTGPRCSPDTSKSIRAGVEGLLPDARLVFTNQLSNSLQPSTARQPGEMKTLLTGKYGTQNSGGQTGGKWDFRIE